MPVNVIPLYVNVICGKIIKTETELLLLHRIIFPNSFDPKFYLPYQSCNCATNLKPSENNTKNDW